jgi:hypothetical protein
VGTNAEIAVLNSSGKLVMESIIETKANTILKFVHGLGGGLYLTFEEGTWAAWLFCGHLTAYRVKECSESPMLLWRWPADAQVIERFTEVKEEQNGHRKNKSSRHELRIYFD